ncbi:hypothetical protein CYMTET_36558, partial [Cymbomonas tetramitiformis]
MRSACQPSVDPVSLQDRRVRKGLESTVSPQNALRYSKIRTLAYEKLRQAGTPRATASYSEVRDAPAPETQATLNQNHEGSLETEMKRQTAWKLLNSWRESDEISYDHSLIEKGTRAAYDDLASRNTALCPPPYKSPFDMIDDLPTTDMHQQHAQAMAQMQASRQRAEANLLSTPAPSPPILRALDACFATAVGDAKAILNFDVAAAVQQMQVLSFASKEDSLMEKKTLPELHSSNSWWDKSGCTWEETVESYG